MIYEYPSVDAPIRQGDIFVGLPRLDISLRKLVVIGKDDTVLETSWASVLQAGEPVSAVIGARPVTAIVATQDCDAQTAPDITLCEVRDFLDVYRVSEPQSAKGWVNVITQHARKNLKWFYLPPDATVGFASRMAVDFFVTLRVRREELEGMCHLRKARLADEAEQHFRARMSHFFRRYPYDEWYALDKAEFEAYSAQHADAAPRPWQT